MRSSILSPTKTGALVGLLVSFIYAIVIWSPSFSNFVINALYTMYARAPSSIMTQRQFVARELVLLVISPLVAGTIAGAIFPLLHRHLALKLGRVTSVVVAPLSFWLLQTPYGLFILQSAYMPEVLGPWILVSLVTALFFAYIFTRCQRR